MSEILRRKLRPVRVEEEQPHALVDQAWRLALARALREGAGLAAETTSLTSRSSGLIELPELPPERALIALLDSPGGAMGIAVLSPELTASVIEMQTIGRFGSSAAPPRRPTRTDAAMIAPVLDRALSRFDFLIQDLAERRVGAGFRFASLLDDARSIGLLLDDLPYHLLTARLSLAEGARSGEVILALPLAPEVPAAAPVPKAPEPEDFASDLGQTECELQAVLGQRLLTLTEVTQMEPGQLLMLNDASIARISLRGIDGKPVAEARLGQQNGFRALRILSMSGEARSGSAGQAVHSADLPAWSASQTTDPEKFVANPDQDQASFPDPDGLDFRASA